MQTKKRFYMNIFLLLLFFFIALDVPQSKLLADDAYYIIYLNQLVPTTKQRLFNLKFMRLTKKLKKSEGEQALLNPDDSKNLKDLFLHPQDNPEHFISKQSIINSIEKVNGGAHNIPEYPQVLQYGMQDSTNVITINCEDEVCKLDDLHTGYAQIVQQCQGKGLIHTPLVSFMIKENEIRLKLIYHPCDMPKYPTCCCLDPAVWCLESPSNRCLDRHSYQACKEVDATCGNCIPHFFEAISQMGWAFNSVPIGIAGCCCYTGCQCMQMCKPI